MAFVACALLLGNALAIGLDANLSRGFGAEPRSLSWAADQQRAVLLARQGDTGAALGILQQLQHEHPDDLGVTRDLIVVSVWAGHDTEAVQLFSALRPGPQPDYVIAAAALAYRHLGQTAAALTLYRQGLSQSPASVDFITGVIRALVDVRQIAQGLALAESDIKIHGERPGVLLSAGYATSARKQPVESLRYIDRALRVAPANRDAQHDRIMAIDEMGAPQVALHAAAENPGVISAAELRAIDGDAAAALVRWGVFEPASEEHRFAATDRAIAALDALIARWSREGDAARNALLRARFDRMVAWRDRVRMADVLAEYKNLRKQKIAIPGYALVAAADAHLYFRHPEKARDLYLQGLAVDPQNPETRLALFYADIDLEDFDAAFRQADSEVARQPIWLTLKGLQAPLENPDRATADLAAASARLYADELAEAHARIATMAEAAPNNTRYLSALADVYSARGWPRRASEEYEISRALQARNVTTEVGQARNNLDLRLYPQVEAETADLSARFPENLEVRRLARLWQVHNMAEFRLTVEPTFSSPTNIQRGSGISAEAQIYSPPLAYDWRLFASEYAAREQLPEGEGMVTLRRSAAGIEYSGLDLVASLEGTVNAYGPKTSTSLDSNLGDGRGGVRARVDWSLSDAWSIGSGAELFALDTPLRALGNGITANAAQADIAYRVSESRAFKLIGEVMGFSDRNLRTSLDGRFTQRLLTLPRFNIDGVLDLAASQNTAGDNVPYFNPRRDGLASFGLSINQVIYRRYEFIYDHHLMITPGTYWQQGFGGGYAASLLYEQRLRLNDVFEAGIGVTFSRQQYDGRYQNTVAASLTLRERF